ncbi:MAG: acyltransferase [Saprospiraceae bacterium]|nr:acyltransferase [Saprospiraceae bacterium]MCF8250708.1 acyltransferase [Saprospiraceae bacterium]MCF8279764.1 acyltransferase [Bacteroidales bacterium]MCF8310530.1 acyltransferase [Saprospiraceae bacterium]MCF8440838.1 acyltransferase [Saprospiraceae bacterium]
MLKQVLTKIIRLKKPGFAFDEAVSSLVVRELLFQKLGSFLRSWKLVFGGRVPSGLFLGKNVRLQNLPNIRFGKLVQLEDFVHVSALGKRPISFGNNVRIGAFSRIITSTTLYEMGSHITIGNNVGIGEFAYLGGAGGLDIGDDCIIGQYLSCHPENHVFSDPTTPIRLQPTTRMGIQIGSNCWIGAKVTILDGVTVGDNCVIAAGAVVTRSMPANSVIGGVPARVLKSTIEVKSVVVTQSHTDNKPVTRQAHQQL